ncbi:hypothetical protein SKAU_G00277000 [Synaphobranchus kaupii]|uniref:CCHC-type domain-containing protein n=1 Tax=Synaphobranchus kaupii TaxID=118154 RepID=A0A9Q1IR64_SYNKA|nr:hypothetical protein SKAU_G00277000 [Synaphobranchus kaupii]
MEEVELAAEIAAADAKMNVLLSKDESAPQGDPMNVYNDGADNASEPPDQPTLPDTSVVDFIPVSSVPKTPLQRAVVIHSSPQGGDVAAGPQGQGPDLSNISQDSISVMVQKQNEIAQLVIRQQNLSLLPKRELTVFDGNPLSYQSFMHAFKHLIEDKTSSGQDRLYFLEQFTSGQARDLVRSCLHMDAQMGYPEAMRLLKKHFGDEMKIANAYLDKALNWPAVKADDGKALHAYGLYLRECSNAMQGMDYMDELDVTSTLKLIISKLPYKLRDRWRGKAYELSEKSKTRARFIHVVEFMEAQANILLHPAFGDIKDSDLTPNKRLTAKTTDPKTAKRGSSFVTTVTVAEVGNTRQGFTGQQRAETSVATSGLCCHCEGKHAIVDCFKFRSEPHENKFECLKRNGHCFGCLKKGHMSKECKRRLDCQICQGKHPTLLHINRDVKQGTRRAPGPTEQKKTPSSNGLVSTDQLTGAGKECALAIVPVQVKVAKGSKSVLTYAFLDPGSSATFCTENIMNKLNAKGRRTQILLRTLGQEGTVKSYELKGLEISNIDGEGHIELPEVYTQVKIPVSKQNLLTQSDLKKWPYLGEIQLRKIEADVELLIGLNVPKAMEPWQVINSQGNGPYAVKTLLGWVVNGPLSSCPATEESGSRSVTANRISMEKLKDMLVQQYNQDFPEKDHEEKKEMSCEDKRFVDLATSSVMLKNKHYHLPLPFRDKNVVMPNNRKMAVQRTVNLARRFKRDSAYAAEYKTFMDNVLAKGYAERVPQEELLRNDGHVWHIPHHGVYHKRKNKLRVVFDCSSSYRGRSLNAELLQGPDLANSLLGVLLRFRQERIAIMADIEAMYYQVKVHEDHRDFLRFLWWPGGDTTKPLEAYRMNVHLFGAVSSPSIANFALKQTGCDNPDQYSMEVLHTIKHGFYVDDCLKEDFTLTKWVSNSQEVLRTVPESHRAALVQKLDLDPEKPPLERVLGIQWNIQRDTFTFVVSIQNRAPTRRAILSIVSSVYDPLGFLSPFILTAKQILQRLCTEKCGWDDVIPDELSKPWQRWLMELEQLSRFEVDRCTMPTNFGHARTAELHHFCDASEVGFGTVSYIRLKNDKGDVHIAFVLGKSRVTPLKQITIPRLELAAATLVVKVDRMLQKELQMKLESSTYWTDSTSVLKYINNQTTRFHTYVANRIAVIHNLSQRHQWRHVRTKENPADARLTWIAH